MGKKLIIKGADFSANCIEKEYTRLAWVKSNKENQYFNTGVYFNDANIRMEVEVSVSSSVISDVVSSDYRYRICGLVGGNTTRINIAFLKATTGANNKFHVTFGNAPEQAVGNAITNEGKYTIAIDRTKKYIDGVSADLTKATSSTEDVVNESLIPSSEVPISCMGIVNCSSNAEKACVLPIHAFRLYKGNTKIMELIPVMRNNDSKICMYDTVNGEYILTNDGSNPDYGTLESV